MKKTILTSTTVLFLLFFSLALAEAEPQTIETSESYVFSQNTEASFAEAEEFARMQAQRRVAEQAGVYIESYSKTQNATLTKDEVTALAAHIMQIESESVSKKILDNGDISFTVTIRASVDPEVSDLGAVLKDHVQFHKILRGYREIQNRYEEQKKLNEKLKRQVIENESIGKEEETRLQRNKKEAQIPFQINSALKKAEAFLGAGDFDGALSEYQKVFRLNPNESLAYIGLGKVLIAKNQFKQAKDILEQGTERFPESIHMFTQLGLVYFLLKDYDKAVETVKYAISIDKHEKNAFFNSVRDGMESSNPRDGAGVYEAYKMLGDIYYDMGKTQIALEVYKQALSLSPINTAEIYVRIGLTYDRLGEKQQALTTMQHGLAVEPAYFELTPNTYLDLGRICLDTKNWPMAVEYLTREIQLNLPSVMLDRAYYFRAIAYTMLGQREKALDDAEKAMELERSLHNLKFEDIVFIVEANLKGVTK